MYVTLVTNVYYNMCKLVAELVRYCKKYCLIKKNKNHSSTYKSIFKRFCEVLKGNSVKTVEYGPETLTNVG